MLEVGKRALSRAVPRLRYAKAMSLTRPQHIADESIFVNKEKRTIIALFVDDILITDLDKAEIEKVKDHFKAEYKMKDIETISKYLGLNVRQSTDKITLQVGQATYI